MRTRKNVFALIALIGCLSPALSGASDDNRDRDRDEGRNSGVQVGPRPYYLVDKMSPGPLKRKLEHCSAGPFYKTDFSIGHRGGGTAAISGAHQGKPRSGRAHGRRHPGMRRDVHQGRSTGVPPRPVRSAHHHEHPGDAACEQVLQALRAGRVRRQRQADQGGLGAVLHQRPDGRRVQVPQGQDGRVQSQRQDRRRSTRAEPRTGAPTSTRPAARC